MQLIKTRLLIFLLLAGALVVTLGFGVTNVLADKDPFHPELPFLDEDGVNVLDSGEPVSTMNTCGECHDTDFIVDHSYHVDLGYKAGQANGNAWDSSNGYLGNWNPVVYNYMLFTDRLPLDLTLAEWLMTDAARHTGGGPALLTPTGDPLSNETTAGIEYLSSYRDPVTSELTEWNWDVSGAVEMNCFLCHLEESSNDFRVEALQSGDFKWANTATLANTGLVEMTGGEWQWNADAFDENGEVLVSLLNIQDPTDANCGQCHGQVHPANGGLLMLGGNENWTTMTTGQVFSPEKINNSGLNLEDKEDIYRSWDIHSERLVSCTDCHYSLNNPAYITQTGDNPDHLVFDPRRLEIDEYLEKPVHDFARGEGSYSSISDEQQASMRRCETCHDSAQTHDWLVYAERHLEVLNCETCHIPQVYAPAYQQVDWTVLTLNGEGQTLSRGIDAETGLISGYQPVLLMRENADGTQKIQPYNLLTAWFWVYGENETPIPGWALEAAWFDSSAYNDEVLSLFDANDDKALDETELRITTDLQQQYFTEVFAGMGFEDVHIKGEIQTYAIHHNVTNGEWALNDCSACHSKESRIYQTISLSDYAPGGVVPVFSPNISNVAVTQVEIDENGVVKLQPEAGEEGVYIFGHDNVDWIDLLGLVMFAGVIAGISGHAVLRIIAARRMPRVEHRTKRVYMYNAYDRMWHWLQTLAIMLLLCTGLIIHNPDLLGFLNFDGVVLVHNTLAVILAANAALALVSNLFSGRIKRFLPEPKGFFNQSIEQALYYIRGIFKHEAHPFEKNPADRLNPLQKITYLGILNVLLPLQGLTGILMWGVQTFPEISNALGGLPFLAPFHTLISWTFASFIVGHVYLTTTGPKPFDAIKAMLIGWEDIEVHDGEHHNHEEAL